MAYHISTAEAQAWLETTKLTLDADLDVELEDSISTVVLARLADLFDTTLWVDPASTPKLIRKIIAMKYAAAYYLRQFSEDPDVNQYALQLDIDADTLLEGIINGTLTLVELPTESEGIGSPAYYPNDASSAMCPTYADPSLGGPAFTMGTIW